MPRFDARSQHATEVHAPARAVFRAVEAVTGKDVRFSREFEFIRAAIGRFWRLAGNEPVLFGSPEEFLSFTEPGFAKAVVGFRLDPSGAEVLLTTETRFVATDETTRRLMSRYWRIIRPGSDLIRMEWLRAIRRRAPSFV